MDNHVHEWEPALVFHRQGRVCDECGVWEQITRGQFKRQFGREDLKRVIQMGKETWTTTPP